MSRNRIDQVVEVILDTDIGPDCDDAGALAVLHRLADLGKANIAGVMHCTSSPWGVGCIAALNTYYGRPHIPIGTLQEAGFLDDEQYAKYNRYLAEHYPHPYREGKEAEDATVLYRKLLATSADNSVVIIAIGPLINLQKLMESESDEHASLSGVELIRRKVKQLVVMGGQFPAGSEWNFMMHPASARAICDQWPTPVLFCGFEAGEQIYTGSQLFEDPAISSDHPVRKAYELYLDGGTKRNSWDLVAVWVGVLGLGKMWSSVEHGKVSVDDEGGNLWIPTKERSSHAFVKLEASLQEAASVLDAWLVGKSPEFDI